MSNLLYPDIRTEGHYNMMGGVCLSVHLSVRVSVLTQQREGRSKKLKLVEWKPIIRVTREPI